MANISRLRVVLMHDASQSAWTLPLAVVYWLYTTNTRGDLIAINKLFTNVIMAVKIHVLSYLRYTL
jgi:hypothetical protein